MRVSLARSSSSVSLAFGVCLCAMRKKALPPRPEKDFTICSIAWDLDIVQRHTSAGFDHIPDSIVYRRFFQFLDFIQRHGLTARTVATSLADITPSTILRNSDLTEHGFRFIQYAEPRWCKRLYKDTGADKEIAFLDRWFQKYQRLSVPIE